MPSVDNNGVYEVGRVTFSFAAAATPRGQFCEFFNKQEQTQFVCISHKLPSVFCSFPKIALAMCVLNNKVVEPKSRTNIRQLFSQVFYPPLKAMLPRQYREGERNRICGSQEFKELNLKSSTAVGYIVSCG